MADQIRQLVESESRLAREVNEHEKKEVAFRETLSEADVIMSSIEQSYHSIDSTAVSLSTNIRG